MAMHDQPTPPGDPLARSLLWLFSRDRLRDINRWFMVPTFRLGLGSLIGGPLAGWVMILRTRGHRTGQPRYAGLDYVIDGGSVYCLAGFGRATHWFRNLLADPNVEVMLPGRTVAGTAEEVTDPDERARVVPRIIRASGVPGFLIGANPWTAGDERILELLAGIPLVRIRPTGLASGPADPGGLLWVVKVLLAVLLVRRLLGRRRET
jgi:deazaflavin-dependent oxidoreductase (nitroreductase family)